jgi:protein-S-isoprenylcysteine O-methyltransferase Ste14
MGNRGLTDWIFIIIQIALLGLFIWRPFFLSQWLSEAFRFVGSLGMFAGAAFLLAGLWSLRENLRIFPSPKSEGDLIESGIYAWVRHPIYAGIIFLALGWSLYQEDLMRLLFSLLIMVFFTLKANYEERLLRDKFPGYADYQLRTGRFFPARTKLVEKPSVVNSADAATETKEDSQDSTRDLNGEGEAKQELD